jgi:hypothetical protein
MCTRENKPSGSSPSGAWMPDSRRILVAVGGAPARRMMRVAIDTRQTEDLQGLPAQMANLALSPDGRTLAYTWPMTAAG